MLKRLRIKFIALNMATIFLVMVVAFVGICLNERQQNFQEVQTSLGGAIYKAAEADQKAKAQTELIRKAALRNRRPPSKVRSTHRRPIPLTEKARRRSPKKRAAWS
ncbi:MAG: hypothetical protein ACLTQI_08485 [Slackia sp.]